MAETPLSDRIIEIQNTTLQLVLSVINNDNEASQNCKELVFDVISNAEDYVKLLKSKETSEYPSKNA